MELAMITLFVSFGLFCGVLADVASLGNGKTAPKTGPSSFAGSSGWNNYPQPSGGNDRGSIWSLPGPVYGNGGANVPNSPYNTGSEIGVNYGNGGGAWPASPYGNSQPSGNGQPQTSYGNGGNWNGYPNGNNGNLGGSNLPYNMGSGQPVGAGSNQIQFSPGTSQGQAGQGNWPQIQSQPGTGGQPLTNNGFPSQPIVRYPYWNPHGVNQGPVKAPLLPRTKPTPKASVDSATQTPAQTLSKTVTPRTDQKTNPEAATITVSATTPKAPPSNGLPPKSKDLNQGHGDAAEPPRDGSGHEDSKNKTVAADGSGSSNGEHNNNLTGSNDESAKTGTTPADKNSYGDSSSKTEPGISKLEPNGHINMDKPSNSTQNGNGSDGSNENSGVVDGSTGTDNGDGVKGESHNHSHDCHKHEHGSHEDAAHHSDKHEDDSDSHSNASSNNGHGWGDLDSKPSDNAGSNSKNTSGNETEGSPKITIHKPGNGDHGFEVYKRL